MGKVNIRPYCSPICWLALNIGSTGLALSSDNLWASSGEIAFGVYCFYKSLSFISEMSSPNNFQRNSPSTLENIE
jgi:hypothetical protein